ncbi:MBL fold metallo-hydrolase [Candidatus Peregrinibacteria bacterium HGW-Peregrinibacteria-1]|nr:MAG: MBL fold metallo-hydrolase [Candidatus Peregrinibacteria bacterium HGW-Peregrinibacteria-1]
MKILFGGAAGEVTGSKHLITFNGKKILLDCGLFQGRRQESDEKNRKLLWDPKEVDVVILSHAHMDHSGILPYLVKNGFEGDIWCTTATKDICNFMLMDSAYIQEREVEWLKKKKKFEEGVTPEALYGAEEVVETMLRFKAVPYHEEFEPVEGVKAKFYNASHILGAAFIVLEMTDPKSGTVKKLCFTGDLGRRGLPLLNPPDEIPDVDVLITETTYGNRLHASLTTVESDLAVIVNQVLADGGRLIIPAFALERTQEIVYHLNLLRKKNLIPPIPIYVDSPLATDVTQVFKRHLDCFNEETREEFSQHGDNPFGFNDLKYTRTVEESKSLNEKQGPMIIISASGMCEHGRILHHLKNNIEDRKNVVLIVGYQAANTLGRKLVEGYKEVNIFGDPHKVKASIYVMDAFSGHADRSDLLDFIARGDQETNKNRKIFLVHGEQTQLDAFKEALATNGLEDVYIPSYGEEVDLGDDF